MSGWLKIMGRFLRNADGGSDTICYAAAPSTNLSAINGRYLWDRRARPIDLAFSGTEASPADVEALVTWLDAGEGECAVEK